jgi:RHS repeat-associated protein
VVAVTDSTGAVVERYQYGDYGDRRVFDAAGNTREYSLIGLRHGFTGQLHDDESGLVLMRHRHLNPKDGKWLQRDPAWYFDQLSLASYVRSSPGRYADPTGWGPQEMFPEENPNPLPYLAVDIPPNEYEPGELWDRLIEPTIDFVWPVLTIFVEPLDVIDGIVETVKDPCDPLNWASMAPIPFVPGSAVRKSDDAVEWIVRHGRPKADRNGPPNSIYEQLDNQTGTTVVSRTFNNNNGRRADRQDYEPGHGIGGPHEHHYRYNVDGFVNNRQDPVPLPPGYGQHPAPIE